MLDSEINAFKKILLKREKIAVIEWGSGTSTKFYTDFLRENGIDYTWTAIEHDPEWYEKVKEWIKDDPRVEIKLIPLGTEYISPTNRRFDVALVDGRLRVPCVNHARTIADTVYLHDAQRKKYDVSGTYIASRLKRIGKNNYISMIWPLAWKLRVALWRMKQRILNV